MDCTLTDGDWVLLDYSQRGPKPDGVFPLLVHGERRIKRVQRVAGGAWLLISDNEHYQTEMIKPEGEKGGERLSPERRHAQTSGVSGSNRPQWKGRRRKDQRTLL